MRPPLLSVLFCALAAFFAVSSAADAKTLRFSGHDFIVRKAGTGGPGPNRWSPRNAWVDKRGRLHLKLSKRKGKWYAAEVYTADQLGFGRYTFQVKVRLGRLDRNVVVGLFTYPTADVGADGTNEIDIEFARWGNANADVGNFTVWPTDPALGPQSHPFRISPRVGRTTHSFEWNADAIAFRSRRGFRSNGGRTISSWTFSPTDPADRTSQDPMPLHLNVWAFEGTPPADGEDVEIVIRKFTFTPQ